MKKFMVLHLLTWIWLCGVAHSGRPASVNIGAVFSFDSIIGRAAKTAMEMAVSDVNEDPTVLMGTKLNLIMKDAMCNAFLGSIGAFQVLEKGVAAIIGPQSSAVAHTVSQIADALQVPLVSYAATDPTLSSLQFPFFIRTTQSDLAQMTAMADIIDFHGWKEVIVVFLDDDYGRNGLSALSDELEKRKLKISYKLPLSIKFDLDEITNLLNQSKVVGPRVYVVHVNPDPRLRIFLIAHKLQMMAKDYVWLVTDWLSATLDSLSPVNQTSFSVLQGVVGLRQHIPDSSKKRAFVSRWIKMQKEGLANTGLNSYGIYAYDTVWAVARAIDIFIKVHNNITFSLPDNYNLSHTVGIGILLDKLKIFAGGSDLVDILLQSNFTGVSGQLHFNSDRSIVSGGYDIINVNQMGISGVGFWSNNSGFSVVPPTALKKRKYNRFSQDQKLGKVIWPGGVTDRPRGWVIADNTKPLRIGVPKRASFVEFVTELPDSHQIQGYCIDVFKKALEFIPYEVPFVFKPFGNGKENPNYDALVKMVDENVYDAVVGDIAIVTNRTMIVDFSQPFASSSLVIVAPINKARSNAWVFLQPFTADMWCATAASFLVVGVVIWILEHRVNNDFRGPPKKQLLTMLMFSLSTLFKKNQEDTVSSLSKMVMIVWLFLLMVITASYTASLTSILTVEQLSSPITGIDSLIASNWPIGFQVGSFTYNYLTDNLYVSKSRLISLGSPEEYATALKKGPSGGGVAAIIDELPYVELFLSNETDFGIIGQPFARSSWGFAFQRESPLAFDMSTAILKLSENGDLRKIHEKWFCKMRCPEDRTSNSKPDQLHLISFWGLYLSCGIVSLVALALFLLRMIRQYARFKQRQKNVASSSPEPSGIHCSQVVVNFFNFIDEKEEAIKKMFTQCDNHQNPN
ncbi:glutamate receptor 3.7-like isoform X1 [Glycine soja]|uniref:Glutamate receptor n=1 Tax=Glycine soja TaxID=3848 RepID=A0A445IC93_GLYSO|nr:glutamate receptor 3.7-like isoform X1 [Glycine soja]RZB83676.1 Glutamate receptor 3.7 [Glycine soja]